MAVGPYTMKPEFSRFSCEQQGEGADRISATSTSHAPRAPLSRFHSATHLEDNLPRILEYVRHDLGVRRGRHVVEDLTGGEANMHRSE